jgi:hypothetical protein
MSLQSPKKVTQGNYNLTMTSPTLSPRLKYTASGWVITPEWIAWASEQRQQLIGELLGHGNWFSRPPRRDVLESLFAPWVSKTMQGEMKFFCASPDCSGGSGSAVWALESLTMTSSAITPNWTIRDFVAEPEQDTISLFGGDEEDEEEREIQFEDIELASPAEPPTKMRNREWEAAKFLAKERVREARLKAQIADRLAAKEESRFYTKFGDLDEEESRFSEYDLTEDEAEGGSDSDQP